MRHNRFFLLSVLGGVLLGCSGDTNGIAPNRSMSALYWALQLNQHAVNLALVPSYDTVQLRATALAANGDPLTTAGPVSYTATDSMVTVTPSGLVTAHYPTERSMVIASLRTQQITRADTVFVQVTSTPPASPLAYFSIHPGVGDSAKVALDNPSQGYVSGNVSLTATDVNGTSLPVLVTYTSSNPDVALIDGHGHISPITVGHATFTATTLAWGALKRDSVQYTIGYPLFTLVTAQSLTPIGGSTTPALAFAPQTFTVGVGGFVFFSNPNTLPIDVVFDDSLAVTGGADLLGDIAEAGNIPPFIDGSAINSGRLFHTVGSYPYHSRLYGTGGTITVSAGP